MRVLIAIGTDPHRRREIVPHAGVVGEIVMVAADKTRFCYRGLTSRRLCGACAEVAERDTSPKEIASKEAAVFGITSRQAINELAALVLDDLAWLVDFEVGTLIRLTPHGRMIAHQNPERLRQESKTWAKKQRASGYLPLLVRNRNGWKVVSIWWPGSVVIVDVEKLVDQVRTYRGLKTVAELEVL